MVISRALSYLALRRMKMSLHTIILTLSPVVAIGWALLLFHKTPGPQQLHGGLGVLAGIAIISAARIRGARRATRFDEAPA